jgi:hypothetical protein
LNHVLYLNLHLLFYHPDRTRVLQKEAAPIEMSYFEYESVIRGTNGELTLVDEIKVTVSLSKDGALTISMETNTIEKFGAHLPECVTSVIFYASSFTAPLSEEKQQRLRDLSNRLPNLNTIHFRAKEGKAKADRKMSPFAMSQIIDAMASTPTKLKGFSMDELCLTGSRTDYHQFVETCRKKTFEIIQLGWNVECKCNFNTANHELSLAEALICSSPKIQSISFPPRPRPPPHPYVNYHFRNSLHNFISSVAFPQLEQKPMNILEQLAMLSLDLSDERQILALSKIPTHAPKLRDLQIILLHSVPRKISPQLCSAIETVMKETKTMTDIAVELYPCRHRPLSDRSLVENNQAWIESIISGMKFNRTIESLTLHAPISEAHEHDIDRTLKENFTLKYFCSSYWTDPRKRCSIRSIIVSLLLNRAGRAHLLGNTHSVSSREEWIKALARVNTDTERQKWKERYDDEVELDDDEDEIVFRITGETRQTEDEIRQIYAAKWEETVMLDALFFFLSQHSTLCDLSALDGAELTNPRKRKASAILGAL